MGWLFAVGLAALALGGLWQGGRVNRLALELAGAALLAALAGYAWQGSPGQPGQPVAAPAPRG
ncbi:hypothetical protein ACFOD9_05355 [Novosphingobium bradum]|uniref:Uncharacterized protein n=1 Tax=Novosphingobium bradum TaxID=1737444 RepID=A0ABV7ILX7_9SPHN